MSRRPAAPKSPRSSTAPSRRPSRPSTRPPARPNRPSATARPARPADAERPGESRGFRREDRAPHDRLRGGRSKRGGAKPAQAAAPPAPRALKPPPPDNRPGAIRLQKLLSMAGIASRRAAEEYITGGRVTINGQTVDTLGAKAVPDIDDVRVDGRRVKTPTRLRYILLNKPRGYVTTRKDPEGRRTVMELLGGVRDYVYPVGRLDYETEGLLLMTSDGELAARLTHPRHEVPRIYEAIVAGAPDHAAIDELRRGVFLDGRRTSEADVTRGQTIGKGREQTTKLVLTLFEGRNRQVREMCAIVGHPVRSLQRVRMGTLSLRGLEVGAWRDLTPAEVAALKAATRP